MPPTMTNSIHSDDECESSLTDSENRRCWVAAIGNMQAKVLMNLETC
jgi:hypothetical protein